MRRRVRTDHLVVVGRIFAHRSRTEVIGEAGLTIAVDVVHRGGHVRAREIRLEIIVVGEQIRVMLVERMRLVGQKEIDVRHGFVRRWIVRIQLQMHVSNRRRVR